MVHSTASRQLTQHPLHNVKIRIWEAFSYVLYHYRYLNSFLLVNLLTCTQRSLLANKQNGCQRKFSVLRKRGKFGGQITMKEWKPHLL